MLVPELLQGLLAIQILDRLFCKLSKCLRMYPALSKSPIAERKQSAYSNEASIAMLLVSLLLHESAHASVFAVNEVDQVLSHAVKARREALVFDSIEIGLRVGLFPGNRVPVELSAVTRLHPRRWRLMYAVELTPPFGRRSPGKALRLEAPQTGPLELLTARTDGKSESCLHEMFQLLSDATIVKVA